MNYIEHFVDYLQNKNRSKNTIKNYTTDIKVFHKWTKDIYGIKDSANVDSNVAFEYEKYLTKSGKSPATRARIISSLKTYFSFLKSQKIIQENPVHEMSTPKINKTLPKFLTEEECKQLINSIDGSLKERNIAIIMMFLMTGMRLTELVNIKLEQVKNDCLIITGKGSKDRTIYINSVLRNVINNKKSINQNRKRRHERTQIKAYLCYINV
jgi:integrase/recombinase XerD